MAITVTPDLLTIADCDSNTGWSLGDVDTDLFVQGTGCLGEQVKATTGAVFAYTPPASIDLSAGEHLYQWMFVAGAVDTKANGGYRIYLESTAGNDATFYVGGSDTVIGGWYCFVLDPSSTPDISNGTLDLTNITKIGVQFKTVTSIAGTGNNVFWDISRYGYGYEVTSLVTDTITLDDIYLIDDNVSNKYGILSTSNGVFFAKGQITYGNATGSDINATISDSLLIFTEDSVATNFFQIKLSGSTGATSNLTISSSVIKGAGSSVVLDSTGVDSVLTMSGSAITNMSYVDLIAGHSATSCTFNGCGLITPLTAIFTDNTISNSLETTSYALLLEQTHNVARVTYSDNYWALGVNPATSGASYNEDGGIFSGNTADVYNIHATNDVTVNQTNGSNVTTSATSGGVVTIVQAPITTLITVKDIVTGTIIVGAMVYLVGVGGDLDGVEIFKEVTDVTGQVSDTRAIASDQVVTGRVRMSTTTPLYKTVPINETISSTIGLTLNVSMIRDD